MSNARNLSKLIPSASGQIQASDIESGAVASSLGYTPVNKAGDTAIGLEAYGSDGSGERQTPKDVFTVSAHNPSTPYTGFGAGVVFKSSDYTSGAPRLQARIRNAITNDSIRTTGSALVFDVTATAGGSLYEAMRIDNAGSVTMPYQPAFCVHSPNNGDVDAVQKFQSIVVNRGNHYSTTTGYFTAPVAGCYQFNWHILSNTLQGYHYGYLSKNGNIVVYAQAYTESGIPSTGETVGGSAIVELAAGDWVGYYHYGGSYTDAYNGTYSVFSGHLLG